MARIAPLAVAMATLVGCASMAGSGSLPQTESAALDQSAQSWRWHEIGKSVQGKPIHARVVGHGPLKVFVIGSIHGDEREGARLVESLAIMFRDEAYAQRATICMIRDANPDGSSRNQRRNSRGVDLNRNWPASNFSPSRARGSAPLSEPEAQAVAAQLESFDPDLVIVFHSIHSGPFLNYDGPAQRYAQAFVDGASEVDPRWRVVADMGYPTPGSLGSWVGVDQGVPILTVEFDRGQDLASTWMATKSAIEHVIVGEPVSVQAVRAESHGGELDDESAATADAPAAASPR